MIIVNAYIYDLYCIWKTHSRISIFPIFPRVHVRPPFFNNLVHGRFCKKSREEEIKKKDNLSVTGGGKKKSKCLWLEEKNLNLAKNRERSYFILLGRKTRKDF